jgi:tetratricopeptide repeat protein
VPTCPSCGKELPGEFPFCPFCAAPLTEPSTTSVHEERKVVSVLFCDLVGGVESRTPLVAHALCACRAQLAEAAGEYAEGVALYTEAAERWREFGNVPERAYALLGQGRCLATLGKPEAEEPLREARELFASMGYKPALAETEALLGEGEAAAV